MKDSSFQPVLSVGYGNRPVREFLNLMSEFEVTHVVDVRSSPYSRFNPDFGLDNLRFSLKESSFSYVFMGDTLGGRPSDPSCYEDGFVVYDRMRETPPFLLGIDRLLKAMRNPDWRLCVMCSEGRPEDCHRCKLIGRHLADIGISMLHIDQHGTLLDQEKVIQKVNQGQEALFEEAYRSRGKYRVTE